MYRLCARLEINILIILSIKVKCISQFLEELLIGRAMWEICYSQSEALSRSG